MKSLGYQNSNATSKYFGHVKPCSQQARICMAWPSINSSIWTLFIKALFWSRTTWTKFFNDFNENVLIIWCYFRIAKETKIISNLKAFNKLFITSGLWQSFRILWNNKKGDNKLGFKLIFLCPNFIISWEIVILPTNK